jgi:hypothetical protein
MEADESAIRADQRSTSVSAVERAKTRAIRFRPWQKDHVGLHVEVHPPAGGARPGGTLSDSFLQVFGVERHSRSFRITFGGQSCQLPPPEENNRGRIQARPDLPGKWQAAILEAEDNRPKLRVVSAD